MSGLTCGGLPQVKEELLVEALTKRKTVTVNDKLILSYSHSEVGAKHKDISATCYCCIGVHLCISYLAYRLVCNGSNAENKQFPHVGLINYIKLKRNK